MAGPRAKTVGKVALCLAVGFALAVPAVFVNTAIGYAAFIAYIVVLVASFVYVRILQRGISYEVNVGGGQCYRGDRGDFSLTVKNDSLLPAVRVQVLFYLSDLFGGEGATEVHNITLGPRRSKDFDFGTRFDHIGLYEVGIKQFQIMDLIGVFSYTRKNTHMATMRVLPRLFDVDDLPLSTDSAIEAKKNFTTVLNEGMDYASVRSYEWGDPIKTIHWKLSSRLPEGEYLTRLYETNANPGIAIIADFDAPEYTVDQLMSIYDTVVECSFSLERYADEAGLDAELIFQDVQKAQRRFFTPLARKRLEILQCMPKIYSPGTGREALALIQNELNSTFAQYNLVVCTSVISKDLVESLVAAKSGKRCPMLFAIVPDTVEDERRKELTKQLEPLGAAGVYYRIVSGATSLAAAAVPGMGEVSGFEAPDNGAMPQGNAGRAATSSRPAGVPREVGWVANGGSAPGGVVPEAPSAGWEAA